jgi:hypothetical protein
MTLESEWEEDLVKRGLPREVASAIAKDAVKFGIPVGNIEIKGLPPELNTEEQPFLKEVKKKTLDNNRKIELAALGALLGHLYNVAESLKCIVGISKNSIYEPPGISKIKEDAEFYKDIAFAGKKVLHDISAREGFLPTDVADWLQDIADDKLDVEPPSCFRPKR